MVGNQTSAEGRMVKTIMNEVSDGNEEQDGRGNATLPINWQIIWLNCFCVLVLVRNTIEYLAETLLYIVFIYLINLHISKMYNMMI